MRNPEVNTKYKDSIFRMLFTEKEELLSLYNAVNGTAYTDPEELEVNTLKDVVYMSIKNDISFVIDGRLSLYEHQSTWNGNMPLRNLLYISDLLSGITSDKNLYGSMTVSIPNPKFITFYNGITNKPDRTIQKLSEAYEVTSDEVNLELTVVVLNINHGHNQELMRKCPTLAEYAYYVEKVREYSKDRPIKEAVKLAIEECIKNDKLATFLRTHRDEVTHVSIYEYDAEKHIAMEKEESWNDGRNEGEKIGDLIRLVNQIKKKVMKSKSLELIADELECNPKEIVEIYEVVTRCGAESNAEEIVSQLMKE